MKKLTMRNIFYALKFTEDISTETERLEELFHEKLSEICPEFADFNEIDVSVNELLCESQYMGFVQGFDFCRSLMNGRNL